MLLFFPFLFSPEPDIPKDIYEFKIKSLNGGIIDMSDFKGKKILIVNTASKCKFTKQYEALQKLWEQHKEKMVIIGFPANNFFFEESGSNDTIAGFCKINYGVTFPMAAKVSVRGWNVAPIFKWLTKKKYNGVMDSRVKWNFQKYLLNEQGRLTHIFPPPMEPDNPEVIRAITSGT